MVKKIFLSVLLVVLFLNANTVFADEKNSYACGIAEGYPPYQFRNENGETTGFDADVLRLIFQKTGKELIFHQMNWDDAMGNLAFSSNLDLIGGMEINEDRKRYFDFTSPYYSRKIVVFIRSDNVSINELEDLIDEQITGDRHSAFESLLEKKGIKNKIRIKATDSKEESMKLLKTGEYVAMIAPKEVGLHLARQLNVNVRILAEADCGSPVGIAVKKGNTQLLSIIENAMLELAREGKIEQLYREWFKIRSMINDKG